MGQEVNRAKNSESRGHPGREEWYVFEENMQHEIEGGFVRMAGGALWLEQRMLKAR